MEQVLYVFFVHMLYCIRRIRVRDRKKERDRYTLLGCAKIATVYVVRREPLKTTHAKKLKTSR
jgi:hypothetical protein